MLLAVALSWWWQRSGAGGAPSTQVPSRGPLPMQTNQGQLSMASQPKAISAEALYAKALYARALCAKAGCAKATQAKASWLQSPGSSCLLHCSIKVCSIMVSAFLACTYLVRKPARPEPVWSAPLPGLHLSGQQIDLACADLVLKPICSSNRVWSQAGFRA